MIELEDLGMHNAYSCQYAGVIQAILMPEVEVGDEAGQASLEAGLTLAYDIAEYLERQPCLMGQTGRCGVAEFLIKRAAETPVEITRG